MDEKGYIILYNERGETLEMTKNWQIPPDVVDYIIFKDGNVVKAKNGQSGKIKFKDTYLNTVFNSVRAEGNVRICIKEGTYEINDKLILKSNMDIQGDGIGRTVIKPVQYVDSVFMPEDGLATEYNKFSNVTIRDLTIDMVDGTLASCGVALAHSKDILIERVKFRNWKHHGIELNSSKNVKVKDCDFELTTQTSDAADREAIQIDSADDQTWVTSDFTTDGTPCENILIEGNRFYLVSQEGVTRGVGSHNTAENVHKRIYIIRNYFERVQKAIVLSVAYYQDVVIRGNYIRREQGVNYSNVYALYLQRITNCLVKDNFIYDYKDGDHNMGIFTSDCSYLVIKNNTFENMSFGAMRITKTNNIIVEGNKINNYGLTTSYPAILIYTSSDQAIVRNNIIKNATQGDGIKIEDITSSIVEGNYIENVPGTGIVEAGSSDYNIIKNNILKSVGTALSTVGANTITADNITVT